MTDYTGSYQEYLDDMDAEDRAEMLEEMRALREDFDLCLGCGRPADVDCHLNCTEGL